MHKEPLPPSAQRVADAAAARGLTINIKAPVPDVPSMTTALELYLQKSNKEV